MKCTEEDAKTKWCSFIKVSTGSICTTSSREITDNKCVGSECMAWCQIGPGAEYTDKPILGYCGRSWN